VGELVDLRVDALVDVGVRVADVVHADAGEEIEEEVPVRVLQGRATPSSNASGMSFGYATALLSISSCLSRRRREFGPGTWSTLGSSAKCSSWIGGPAMDQPIRHAPHRIGATSNP